MNKSINNMSKVELINYIRNAFQKRVDKNEMSINEMNESIKRLENADY